MTKYNHRFLSDKFLRRPPGNYCFYGGRLIAMKPKTYRAVEWKPKCGESFFVAYSHDNCPNNPPKQGNGVRCPAV